MTSSTAADCSRSIALREPVFLALIMLLGGRAAGWILFERSTDLPPLARYSGFELDIGSPTELPHYAPTFDAAGNCVSSMSSTSKTTAAPLTISLTKGCRGTHRRPLRPAGRGRRARSSGA